MALFMKNPSVNSSSLNCNWKHCEIYKKAYERLYSRRAGVTTSSIFKGLTILEYAVAVMKSIRERQSKELESIQKRAFR